MAYMSNRTGVPIETGSFLPWLHRPIIVGLFYSRPPPSISRCYLDIHTHHWLVGISIFWNILIFPSIGNLIIPTDELIFFRGGETTNQIIKVSIYVFPHRVETSCNSEGITALISGSPACHDDFHPSNQKPKSGSIIVFVIILQYCS